MVDFALVFSQAEQHELQPRPVDPETKDNYWTGVALFECTNQTTALPG